MDDHQQTGISKHSPARRTTPMQGIKRRKAHPMALEQRMVFDGAAAADFIDFSLDSPPPGIVPASPQPDLAPDSLLPGLVPTSPLPDLAPDSPPSNGQPSNLFQLAASNERLSAATVTASQQILGTDNPVLDRLLGDQLEITLELLDDSILQGEPSRYVAASAEHAAAIQFNRDWLPLLDQQQISNLLIEQYNRHLEQLQPSTAPTGTPAPSLPVSSGQDSPALTLDPTELLPFPEPDILPLPEYWLDIPETTAPADAGQEPASDQPQPSGGILADQDDVLIDWTPDDPSSLIDIPAVPDTPPLLGEGTGTYKPADPSGHGNSRPEVPDLEINPSNTEFQVNSHTLAGQTFPAISGLPDGGFVTTWMSWAQDGSGYGIYAQRYDQHGNPSGKEVQVNSWTTGGQYYPAVSALANGGYVISWDSDGQDGDGDGVYAQRFDRWGQPVADEVRVNSWTADRQYRSAITTLQDGSHVISWSSAQDGDGQGIYAQRFAADGQPIGQEMQVNHRTAGDQDFSAITALSNGGYVISWMSRDKNVQSLETRRFDSAGNPTGPEVRISDWTLSSQYSPAIAALHDGGYVISWQSRDQDPDGNGIQALRFDAAGQPVGTTVQVNSWTSSNQEAPAITTLMDGGYVITWQSAHQDGDSYGIFAQRYDPSGQPVGTEQQVNHWTSDAQGIPSISALQDGGYLVSWASAQQDGDSLGIFAQRYDSNGNPVLRSGQPSLAVIEGDGLQTLYSGSLAQVQDANRDDQHSFQYVYESASSNNRKIRELAVQMSPDGHFSITGNLDVLAAGEQASISFQYTVTDNSDATNDLSAPATVTLYVTGSNDAPRLSDTRLFLDVPLQANPPAGRVGYPLADFTASIADPDSAALKGIAITATNQHLGNWYYSQDDGNHWTVIGSVSEHSALLLADDGQTRLYFAPAPGFSGPVSDALTFKAWDQTQGLAGNLFDSGSNAFSLSSSHVHSNAEAFAHIASSGSTGSPSGIK